MKRTIRLYLMGLLLLTAILPGCSKKLDEYYNDPDQTIKPAIEQLFTEMLDNDRVRPSYWNVRTVLVMHPGIYNQSVGYVNTPTIYQQNPNYTEDLWNDFYLPTVNGGGVMVHYRTIQNTWKELPTEQEKKEMNVFVQAASVVLLDQAAQMVDLWGDIPFSEAGFINTGETINAKFDAAPDVYNSILEELTTAAEYFANAQLSPATQALFSKQDILLRGNLDKWRRYANSLRLRLLMRTSFYNEARAKSAVQLMLQNPSAYPLVEGNANYDPAATDILLEPLTTYTANLYKALIELTNFSAPGYMLNTVMKPANDPRIPVMFDKFGRTVNDVFIPNTDYNGLPTNMNGEQQLLNIGNYAIRDSATFMFNSKLPGIVMTASEVNFLKAEAFERWGGGDAQQAYETAVRQSVIFYYYLNSLNTITATPLPLPANNIITTFLQQPGASYSGTSDEKLEKIWVQKWLHFDFLQSMQGWAEYRRTKVPHLQFYSAPLMGFELPPTRLVYPASETAYNPNYSAVRENDLRTKKVFWDVK